MMRAVFLDRDGVINPEVYYSSSGEWEAPMAAADFQLNAGVIEALRQLGALGYHLILVSNQSAYAKGKVDLASLWAVHERFSSAMDEAGISFLDFFYSFTHPDGRMPGFSGPSLERKPGPYFLILAQAKYNLEMSHSWMIGDRDSDVLCGQAAGVRTIRVGNSGLGGGHAKPDFVAADLREAAGIIAAHERGDASRAGHQGPPRQVAARIGLER